MARQWRRPAVHELWREQPGLYRGFLVDIGTALLLGLLLITGGRQRTQAPAWDVVNTNGGPVAWGVVFLVAGCLLALAAVQPVWLVTWLLWLLALLYLTLALAFLVSVLRDPAQSGSFLGALLASRAAVMHVSRAQAYREGPRWTKSN